MVGAVVVVAVVVAKAVKDSSTPEVGEIERGTLAAVEELLAEVDAVKATLERSLTAGSLYEAANAVRKSLEVQRDRLRNNEKRDMYKDLDEMTVQTRLQHARYNPSSGAYGPTPAQRESLRKARALYDEVAAELTTVVDEEYAALKQALDTAKVPWTPGRGVQQ